MLRQKSPAYPIIKFCELIVTAQAIPSQTSHRATFSKHKSTPKKNPNRAQTIGILQHYLIILSDQEPSQTFDNFLHPYTSAPDEYPQK